MARDKAENTTKDQVEITPEDIAEAEFALAIELVRRPRLFNQNGVWRVKVKELLGNKDVAIAIDALKSSGLATMSTTDTKLTEDSIITFTLTKAARTSKKVVVTENFFKAVTRLKADFYKVRFFSTCMWGVPGLSPCKFLPEYFNQNSWSLSLPGGRAWTRTRDPEGISFVL